MTKLLDTKPMQSLKNSRFYPVYFLLRVPVILPRLVQNEGFLGAFTWLRLRVGFMFGRLFRSGPGFYERPITVFQSRLGFPLTRPVEHLVYDEIFLDQCYAFKGMAEIMRRSGGCFVDFGTHHGMFTNYARVLNPQVEVYGAEMNPASFAVAQQRFAGQPGIHFNNMAIGGTPRKVRVSPAKISVEQSLYSAPTDAGFEVEVVTPVEFVQRHGLADREITLLKMDIEGAEREVFDHPDSIRTVLAKTAAVIMEIHSEADLPLITKELAAAGLRLVDRRGINYFFQRESC